MGKLAPEFLLKIGALESSTANPVGGPRSIRVERDMDVPADLAELELMDRSGIALGDSVTVELGYDGSTEKIFTGEVAGLSPSLSGVRVRTLGTVNRLLNLRVASFYEDQSAGSIVRDLIDKAGLEEGTISEGPTLPRFAVDRRISVFAHVRQIADRLGYELYADRDGKIMFQPLGAAGRLDSIGGFPGAAAGGAQITAALAGGAEGYAFGRHLVALTAEQQSPGYGTVGLGGESPMSSDGDSTASWLTANDTDYRGAAGSAEPHLLVLDGAARTKDLADRFAAGWLATRSRAAHSVSLTILGRPGIDLGQQISTTDVPDSLCNAQGYVRAIRHRFSSSEGFLTDLSINAEADS